MSPLGLAGRVLKAFVLNLAERLLRSTSARVRMAAYRGEAGCEMLKGVSFGQENGLKRTLSEPRKPHFPPESLIFSPASPIFRPKASFFRLQALFSARKPHFPPAIPPLFRLISLHERRSRNMMTRIGGRELAISARQQLNRRRSTAATPAPAPNNHTATSLHPRKPHFPARCAPFSA